MRPQSVSGEDILRRLREHEIARMARDMPPHRLDLLQRPANRFRTRHGAGNPDGEENRAHTAFAHPRNIDRAVRMRHAEIEIVVEQALGCVRVRIDHERPKMQVARPRRYSERDAGIRLSHPPRGSLPCLIPHVD
jgi:hypothetical protein